MVGTWMVLGSFLGGFCIHAGVGIRVGSLWIPILLAVERWPGSLLRFLGWGRILPLPRRQECSGSRLAATRASSKRRISGVPCLAPNHGQRPDGNAGRRLSRRSPWWWIPHWQLRRRRSRWLCGPAVNLAVDTAAPQFCCSPISGNPASWRFRRRARGSVE